MKVTNNNESPLHETFRKIQLVKPGFCMKSITTFLSLFLIAFAGSFFKAEAQSASEWKQKQYVSTYGNGQNFYYLEYLPQAYRDNTNDYPVIISLHGLGFATPGTGIFWDRLKNADFERTIRDGRNYPFIVLSPHQPTEVNGRYNHTATYNDSLRWDPKIIDEVLERAKTELRIDESRIYLLGSSMGGGGVWSYLQAHGDKIAAAVPIAGYTVFNDESGDINVYTEYPSALACNDKVKKTPVWAFHAGNDTWISPLYAYKGVKAINQCTPAPSPLARLTMFASGGHTEIQQKIFQYTGNTADYNLSADPTYSSGVTQTAYMPNNAFGNDIFAWFLSHTSSGGASPAPTFSVNLGDDFSLVPSDKSTTIPSTVNGTATSYNWTQISGPNTATLSGKTTATLTVSNMIVDGTYASQNRPEGYVFRLTVTNAQGQTAYDEIRVKHATPALGTKITTYAYQQKIFNWDTSPYLSYKYSNIPFRLIFPRDYTSRNDGKKYPLILMIHGRGETGTDNDYHLKNGGKLHMDAVLNGTFDGFILFPQWSAPQQPSSDNINKMKEIIDELILHNKVDIDRVHVHGLSSGAMGVWDAIMRHPKVFATAMPMAWTVNMYGYDYNVAKYMHLPLWVSQGGQDGTANPETANNVVKQIRKYGGNVRYLYFPNHGHNAWDDTYKDADFFPFFTRRKKTDIHVYFGQTEFCKGDVINVRMGLTPGFTDYEWQKDGVTIATGATKNELVVTEVGIYRVRFKRGTVWTEWSEPVNINRNRAPSPKPVITTNKKSVHLPSLDGRDEVTLYATTGNAQYFWYKNGQLISGATTSSLTLRDAGSYTVTVVEPGPPATGAIPEEYRPAPARCESLPADAIVVTTQKGPNAPKAPVNLFAFSRSETSVELSYEDKANNETGFEIYRSTQSGGPYTIIDIIGANNLPNPVSYFDNNLTNGTAYFYKIRAINNDGGSDYSNEASTTTVADNQAPSAPQNLIAANSTRSSIRVQWDPATDNVGVVEYQVFMDGNLVGTTANTHFTAEGLIAKTSHTFYVLAKDAAGNISSPSNQITAASINSGLFYTYYHVTGIKTVLDIESKATFIKSGHLNNFSLSPKERNDGIAFIYEGNITIPTSGQYTFYLSSDDGSRLYIDGQEIINHDGDHGCTEKSSNVTLAAGTYPIKVMFYEAGGGECLNVRWQGPGISKALIPDSALKDEFTYPQGPAVPNNLQVAVASYQQLNLTWLDNSNNETGFEIYRSKNSGGPFTIIHKTAANVKAYSDKGLSGNTRYYYKIRAVNASNASDFTGVKNATTLATPAAPNKPNNLTASSVSSSSIQLQWADASSNETGFEIWRTTSAAGNGFILVSTVAANIITFTDLQLPGNTTFYYKVRAKGDGGYSTYTNTASATTQNNTPVLQEILSRTVKFNTTLAFDIYVTDQDKNDPINFSITGLPSFGSFTNNGDNTGTFTFAPGSGNGGAYNISVRAYDQAGASSTKSFTLTVNNNATPVVAAIADQEISQGNSRNINVSASDADGNASLTLSLMNQPSFVTIVNNGNGNGVIKINPDLFETPGTFSHIQVIAKDAQGGVGVATFDLVVKGVDRDFTVYVNFSHGTSLAAFPWNNTGNAGAKEVLDKLVDEEDKISGLQLKLRQDGGPAWNSLRSEVEAELYTPDVRDTRYWSFSTPPVRMTLSGLNPLLKYNFTFFGSSNEYDSYNRTRITRYAIGNEYGEIETYNNTKETVNLTNIQPDQNGTITISVTKKSSSDWKMVINSMIIQAYYDDGSAPDAPSNLSATVLSPSKVRLNWLDNSKSEDGFELLRATNSNGPYAIVTATSNNVSTYLDETVVGRTTYFYKVRAFSGNGRSEDSNVFTVTTPNSAPQLTAPTAIVVKVGDTKVIAVTATDAEKDAITLRAVGLPAFATFADQGNGTGTLSIAPGKLSQVGRYQIKLTALDDTDSKDQLVTLTVLSNEYDEAIYINFGNNVADLPWNNTNRVPAANQIYNNLKDGLGNASPITFTVQSGWTTAEKKGVNTQENSGVYTDSVMYSYWNTANTASLKISGLNPAKLYNFVFFASHETTHEGNTNYTIGTNTVKLNAANNSKNTVALNGITPDSNGDVLITVAKTQFSTGGYLGALVIQSYPTNAKPITPTTLTATAQSRTKIKLDWKDNAGNETAYRVYRSQSPNTGYSLIATLGANSSSYVDNTVVKNRTYYYKVLTVKGELTSEYSNMAWATTYEFLVYINFVGNETRYTYPGTPWNNTKIAAYSGYTFANLKNDAGGNTTVDLIIDQWPSDGGNNDLGISTGNNSGIYPDAVLKAFYFLEANTTAKMRIAELDPNYQYSFIFLGSGDPNIGLFKTSGNLTTDYTFGQTTITQNALGNTSETVQLDGLVPDANREIAFEIKSHKFGSVSANYAIFNTLVIGAYTPETVVVDEEAPTVPGNLVASKMAPNSITLSWSPSIDNSGTIASYELYNGNQLIALVNGNANSYTINNTIPGDTYNFSVLAADGAGNKSQPSGVLPLTYEVLNGLNYAYYEGTWSAMPNYASMTPVKTGFVDNFSLTPKARNSNFGFRFYGYLRVTNAGNYTFYTKSNTGSKLYIDGAEIVSNDFANNASERSGIAYNLSSGWHEIVLDYRNAQETDLLEVWYSGPGVSKVKIPNQVLSRTALVSPVGQPVEFIEVKAALVEQEVQVDWSTASETNNDFFTIEKSYDLDKFVSVGQVKGAGDSHEVKHYNFVDHRVRPGIAYYRIRQTDFDGTEKYSKVVSVNADDIYKLAEVTLFPNPATNDNINIRLMSMDADSEVTVTIMDMMGRVVLEEVFDAVTLMEGQRIKPTHGLGVGTYIVNIKQGSQVVRQRLIIQR